MFEKSTTPTRRVNSPSKIQAVSLDKMDFQPSSTSAPILNSAPPTKSDPSLASLTTPEVGRRTFSLYGTHMKTSPTVVFSLSDPSANPSTSQMPSLPGSTLSLSQKASMIRVYPAFLSPIAQVLLHYTQLNTHVKDSIEHKNSFRGSDLIDIIMACTNLKARSIALLLARALENQNLFHEVTYSHSLKDSRNEFYAFNVNIPSPNSSLPSNTDAFSAGLTTVSNSDALSSQYVENFTNGVFTLLTDCYSPTCMAGNPCYSIMCPNQKVPLKYLNEFSTSTVDQKRKKDGSDIKGKFWSTSVPKDIVASVSEAERKRQEIIFEIVQTEVDFVADLSAMKRIYMEDIRNSDIIPLAVRDSFLATVFLNLDELLGIAQELKGKLLDRQRDAHIVSKVGDIFLSVGDRFSAFIEYGAKQVIARHTLDLERSRNAEFDNLLKSVQRRPESRKLPIESFLARPTTRMGRYPLLLSALIDKTPEKHPDKTLLPTALGIIKDILVRINKEAGKAENTLKLQQLEEKLVFYPGEEVDLKLSDPERLFLREGSITVRRSGYEAEVYVFLLDNFLIMSKKSEGFFKMYKRPIPIQLLVLGPTSDGSSVALLGTDPVKSTSAASSQSNVPAIVAPIEQKGHSFTVVHIGRAGGYYTLVVPFRAEQKSWMDAIEAARNRAFAKKRIFELVTINDAIFPGTSGRIKCSIIFNNRILLGTENGVFISDSPFDSNNLLFSRSDYGARSGITFSKRIDINVSQMDILSEVDQILILSDKTLLMFPSEVLDTSAVTTRKGRKISDNVSFFRQGVCADRQLVCVVKSTALNATIKVFRPHDELSSGNKLRGTLGKLFRGGQDSLRVFREFYIPAVSTSIHFLKTKLCVGCIKGFVVVDLDTLDTQELLDLTDEHLSFVRNKEGLRPISIFRTGAGEFLLCYNEFGFYVDKLGTRTRHDWRINWVGSPSDFTFYHPYIIAYEPSLIEIWHVESGELEQIIPTKSLANLNTDKEFLHFTMMSAGSSGSEGGGNQQLHRLRLLDSSTGRRGSKSP